MAAYDMLSSKKGGNTKGVDNSTLDGMNEDWILKTISSLKDHSYRFKAIRKVYIPKRTGGYRALGIPSVKDKVVLKVMEMVLRENFEDSFCNSSHGFRPNRSYHSCLHSIKYGWGGTKWFIEGDIKN
jgi:retron-type reverse transcriptase